MIKKMYMILSARNKFTLLDIITTDVFDWSSRLAAYSMILTEDRDDIFWTSDLRGIILRTP